ncbi:hypothetical protein N7486_008832 [Penicillium sp. IBT 16267x]|nr:hypothetical protein N7486_008832 [Penicillium sp. IBT 16267x]
MFALLAFCSGGCCQRNSGHYNQAGSYAHPNASQRHQSDDFSPLTTNYQSGEDPNFCVVTIVSQYANGTAHIGNYNAKASKHPRPRSAGRKGW